MKNKMLIVCTLVGASSVANAQPLPLGTVAILSSSGPCLPGASCWLVNVSCPGIEDKQARLRVQNPSVPVRDTALFTTGGPGTTFWGDTGQAASAAISNLQSNGFRTVELAWQTGSWSIGPVSPAVQACRPASVAQFIYEYFNMAANQEYLHASGNSAGSAQIGYMLTHYGLDSILNTAILTSGPPLGRIDLGCFSAETDALRYDSLGQSFIDRSFGFTRGGPCATGDVSYSQLYAEGSVAYGDNDYYYPNTYTYFIFGTADDTNSVDQGMTYFQRLADSRTPHLARQFLDGVPHTLPSTSKGANAVRDAMLHHRNPN